jgi:hypothetical protein
MPPICGVTALGIALNGALASEVARELHARAGIERYLAEHHATED